MIELIVVPWFDDELFVTFVGASRNVLDHTIIMQDQVRTKKTARRACGPDDPCACIGVSLDAHQPCALRHTDDVH